MEGPEPPHWPEKCANYHVFSALEADFCSKNKNIPSTRLAIRSCEGLSVIWTTKLEFLFWIVLKVGQKKWLNLGEDFVFGDHLNLDKKKTIQTNQRSIKIWVKIVWCFFQYPKQPPPKQIPGYAPEWCWWRLAVKCNYNMFDLWGNQN